jgi:hypothetical protein
MIKEGLEQISDAQWAQEMAKIDGITSMSPRRRRRYDAIQFKQFMASVKPVTQGVGLSEEAARMIEMGVEKFVAEGADPTTLPMSRGEIGVYATMNPDEWPAFVSSMSLLPG